MYLCIFFLKYFTVLDYVKNSKYLLIDGAHVEKIIINDDQLNVIFVRHMYSRCIWNSGSTVHEL